MPWRARPARSLHGPSQAAAARSRQSPRASEHDEGTVSYRYRSSWCPPVARRVGAVVRTESLSVRRSRAAGRRPCRSEEHTSELQSLMRISYAVFCLKKKKAKHNTKESADSQTK